MTSKNISVCDHFNNVNSLLIKYQFLDPENDIIPKFWIFNEGRLLKPNNNYLNPDIDIIPGEIRSMLETLFDCKLKIYVTFSMNFEKTRISQYRFIIELDNHLVAEVDSGNIYVHSEEEDFLRKKYNILESMSIHRYFSDKAKNHKLNIFGKNVNMGDMRNGIHGTYSISTVKQLCIIPTIYDTKHISESTIGVELQKLIDKYVHKINQYKYMSIISQHLENPSVFQDMGLSNLNQDTYAHMVACITNIEFQLESQKIQTEEDLLSKVYINTIDTKNAIKHVEVKEPTIDELEAKFQLESQKNQTDGDFLSKAYIEMQVTYSSKSDPHNITIDKKISKYTSQFGGAKEPSIDELEKEFQQMLSRSKPYIRRQPSARQSNDDLEKEFQKMLLQKKKG